MIHIESKSHPYDVVRCDNLSDSLSELSADKSTFFLIDDKLPDLYQTPFASILATGRFVLVKARETNKSYDYLGPIICELLEKRCQRSSQLVVIGGGILQDIGCFIASVLFRGIQWTLYPSTLLAQCDSCIGSKSSLNIASYKNQLGTFYPPHQVIINFDFLRTLTQEEIHSGLGEAIKLHLIDSQESSKWLFQKLNSPAVDVSVLEESVWSSLRIKKRFIEQDEFDHGIRNLLNYGHTFAHALESAANYAIPHGIAVSMGVACATHFSESTGLIPPGEALNLRSQLFPYYASHVKTARALSIETILGPMSQDKKNSGDSITFILTEGPGRMKKVQFPRQEVAGLLTKALEAL